jgi:hypothetical protein
MLSKIIPLVVVLIALTIGAEQLLNRPKPPEQNKPAKQDAAVAEAAVAPLLPADSVSEELKAPDKQAETVSADQPAQILPINDTQTRAEVIPGPPAGFDPLTASPADLERYGIPPRPDPKTDPTGFAVWQQDSQCQRAGDRRSPADQSIPRTRSTGRASGG